MTVTLRPKKKYRTSKQVKKNTHAARTGIGKPKNAKGRPKVPYLVSMGGGKRV